MENNYRNTKGASGFCFLLLSPLPRVCPVLGTLRPRAHAVGIFKLRYAALGNGSDGGIMVFQRPGKEISSKSPL